MRLVSRLGLLFLLQAIASHAAVPVAEESLMVQEPPTANPDTHSPTPPGVIALVFLPSFSHKNASEYSGWLGEWHAAAQKADPGNAYWLLRFPSLRVDSRAEDLELLWRQIWAQFQRKLAAKTSEGVGSAAGRQHRFQAATSAPRLESLVLVAHGIPANRVLEQFLLAKWQDTTWRTIAKRVSWISLAAVRHRLANVVQLDELQSLTVGGGQDGVQRVFRYAQEWFQLHRREPATMRQEEHSLVVLPEANHALILPASSSKAHGSPPDLPVRKSLAAVQAQVTEILVAFVMSDRDQEKRQRLRTWQQHTASYLRPFVDALLLEGSHALLPACTAIDYRAPERVSEPCFLTSPWAEIAQQRLALGKPSDPGSLASKGVRAQVLDQQRKLYELRKIRHPHLVRGCPSQNASCVVVLETVSQLNYESAYEAAHSWLGSVNHAMYLEPPVSARDLGLKAKSRESVHIGTGNKQASYEKLDGGNVRCQEVNQLAWQWALSQVGTRFASSECQHKDDRMYCQEASRLIQEQWKKWIRVERPSFSSLEQKQFGPPLQFGLDLGPYPNVFEWIVFRRLTLEATVDEQGRVESLQVRAPASQFRDSFPLKFSAGIHFCKLLSPARALEWIVTDSQRFRL